MTHLSVLVEWFDRESEPTAAIIDSQSVKTTESCGILGS